MNCLKLLLLMMPLTLVSLSTTGQEMLGSILNTELGKLQQTPKDKETLRKLSYLYLNKEDYDSAIFYGEQLFEIGFKEQDYNRSIIYSHACLGQAYLMKGNAEKAWNHLKQAESIGESHQNDSALCSVYNGLGLYACNVQKDYYGSLSYFFKGIKVAKQCKNERLYAIMLTNLSGIYFLKRDTTGLKYAEECYDFGHKQKDPYLMYCGASALAYMYFLKQEYPNTLGYLKEAEFLLKQNGFQDQTNIYNLYAMTLRKLHRNEEAIEYFEKALSVKDTGNISSVIETYLGNAEVFMDRKEFDTALELLQKGLTLSYEQKHVIYRDRLLKQISACYELSGKTAEALLYFKRYQEEASSLFSADQERIVSEIRAKYDLEHQEKIIQQKQLELYRQNTKLQISIVVCLAALAMTSLLYYLYYKKNKLYLAIVRQNQEAIRSEQQIQKYASSSLTDDKKQNLFQHLETLMREEKIYTDNLLTKDKVAELLGTNRTYLSQIINEQSNLTFTQFVNSFRTKEAIRQLSDPKNDTALKVLSSDLGFNSMTTFYNQFQAATGMTPTQYRKKVRELQKEK